MCKLPLKLDFLLKSKIAMQRHPRSYPRRRKRFINKIPPVPTRKIYMQSLLKFKKKIMSDELMMNEKTTRQMQ